MDEKIIKYRKSHKRCKWCIYNKYYSGLVRHMVGYHNCELKDKIIYSDYKALFCRYYEVKKD